MEERISVEYYIETVDSPERSAEKIAKMQSSGTWSGLDSETQALIRRHGARVENVEYAGEKKSYSLPTRLAPGKKIQAAKALISYPVINFGSNISMLLTTVAGEAFDLMELTAVKVMDINMPDGFLREFPGPSFGMEG